MRFLRVNDWALVLLLVEEIYKLCDAGDAFEREQCKKFRIILSISNKMRNFAAEMLFTESTNHKKMLFVESTNRKKMLFTESTTRE